MSELLPLLQFIFQGFWTWLGFLILVAVMVNGPLALILKMFESRSGVIKASKDSIEIKTDPKS